MLWISSFHGLVCCSGPSHTQHVWTWPESNLIFRLPMRIKKHTFVSVSPGSLWSHNLRHAGDGWCWDHVRPEEELLRHRGWRLTLGFHDCSWTWSEVFSHYASHAKPTRPQNDFCIWGLTNLYVHNQPGLWDLLFSWWIVWLRFLVLILGVWWVYICQMI